MLKRRHRNLRENISTCVKFHHFCTYFVSHYHAATKDGIEMIIHAGLCIVTHWYVTNIRNVASNATERKKFDVIADSTISIPRDALLGF